MANCTRLSARSGTDGNEVVGQIKQKNIPYNLSR